MFQLHSNDHNFTVLLILSFSYWTVNPKSTENNYVLPLDLPRHAVYIQWVTEWFYESVLSLNEQQYESSLNNNTVGTLLNLTQYHTLYEDFIICVSSFNFTTILWCRQCHYLNGFQTETRHKPTQQTKSSKTMLFPTIPQSLRKLYLMVNCCAFLRKAAADTLF